MNLSRPVRSYFSDFGAVFVLIAFIFWFARGMIWDGQLPFFRDLNTYFYPLRFSLGEAFRAGELPLWDRHFAMGFPMLADFQLGVFYPPHLLFLGLPFIQAVSWVYFFHYLVAVIGSYLLCRHWSYPRHQAIIGALLFTLSGTTVSLINLLNHFQSAVWLPWTILFWERFLLRNSWRNFMIMIAGFLMQFLAGSPEIYTMSMVLLMVDGLSLLRKEGDGRMWKVLPWLAAANLAVATLAAVQLLPAIELIFQSRRQESIPYQEAASWSLNPWSLVNLVFLDKRVDMGQGDGTQLFFDRDLPFFVSHYVGAIFLFGICFWLYNSTRNEKATFGILIALSLVLAFGAFTPVYPFLYRHVSVFRTFRYPEKLFFLTQAFLIVVTLRGISSFQRQDSDRSNRILRITCVIWGAIFMLYLALRSHPALVSEYIGRQKAVVLPAHWTLDHVASVLLSFERQLALLAGLLVLFFVEKNGYLRESLFKCLLVTIVFIDLSWAHQGFQYLLKPESVLYGPRILNAPDTDPNRIFYYPSGKNLHAGGFVIKRSPSTPFGEISSIVSSNLLPNSGIYYGFDYMQDINALAKESYLTFLRFANQIEPEKQFRLLGALNVKYVVSFRPLEARGITLVQHFPQHPSWLYKIDRVVPRAYIVHRTKEETNSYQTLENLSGEPFDPMTEVLLDRTLPSSVSSGAISEAKILKYGNLDVRIHAASDKPGVLVFADSFYPGWHVYVDGKEERLLRANYFFRAVGIASGEHIVEFKYEPYWFKVGKFVSFGALIVLVIVSILLFLKSQWCYALEKSCGARFSGRYRDIEADRPLYP
jgi:hypothetical protein